VDLIISNVNYIFRSNDNWINNKILAIMEIDNTDPIRYEFDFDKIKTVDDVKRVLESLMISFTDQYTRFEEVKDLLKEVK